MKYTVVVDGDVFEVEIGPEGRAWVGEDPHDVDLCQVGSNGATHAAGEYSLLLNHRSYEVHIGGRDNGHHWVTVGGKPFRTRLHRGHGTCAGRLERDGGRGPEVCRSPIPSVEMRSPLPGRVVELRTKEGQRVQEQDVVAVLESMKMNLELRAPREGTVKQICARAGDQVAQDEVLAILSETERGHE